MMAVSQGYMLLVVFLAATQINARLSARCPTLPKDCEDIQRRGSNTTGIYIIYPQKTDGVRVRCDMETEGGGWTVIQRRVSDSDFYRSWAEYQFGFGNLTTNFWLGNKLIFLLTSQNWYQLRIDMTHANGTIAYAGYYAFELGDTASQYRLTVSGYHGDAGNALSNGYKFSTFNKDNDAWSGNCAAAYRGGWWYEACHRSNPNGVYGSNKYGKGLNWCPFTGHRSSLTAVQMIVKRWPSNFGETLLTSSGDADLKNVM